MEALLHPISLEDGREARVRFLRSDEGHLLIDLFQRLSPESRYQRFHVPVGELTPEEIRERLPRYTDVDGWDHVALLAVLQEAGREEALAVARYKRTAEQQVAEAAVVVRDDWQRQGIGTELLVQLMAVARQRGVDRFEAWVQGSNRSILRLIAALPQRHQVRAERGETYIVLYLDEPPPPPAA